CHASEARVGALVNPAVDDISGEPEFKHTPARVEPFPVEWYGFILTRNDSSSVDSEAPGDFRGSRRVTWWTRINAVNCMRYEIAGRQLPEAWGAWGRHILGALDHDADYVEYEDASARTYRAAYIVDGRLEACLYIANRTDLPDRKLLAGLF